MQLLWRLQAALPPHAVVLNLYGSTETAADCTCCDATAWLRGNAPAAPGAATSAPLPGQQPSDDATAAAPTHAYNTRSSGLAESGRAGVPDVAQRAEQSSAGGSAVLSAEMVPVGWPLDNMGVFTAAQRKEHEPNCITASHVLDLGEVGEVCVFGAGVSVAYIRCACILHQKHISPANTHCDTACPLA